MKVACEYAAKKGITLGMEDHEGITQNSDTCLEIVHRVDSPFFGINLDITNFIPTARFRKLAPSLRRPARRHTCHIGELYEAGRSRQKTEFRDVQAVNGHMVTEHEQRLLAVLRQVISGDPDVEMDRVSNEEQHQYDLRYHVNGFTLHEALPLRSLCRPQFHFEIAGREGTAPERLVVNYQQTGPCSEVVYMLPLPHDLRYGEFRHRGRLWLDVTTARLWREEREVWVRPKTGAPEFRVIRSEYEYAPSNFDLLLPKRIWMEIFDQARMSRGRIANLDLGGRVAMSYGEFSRFNVSTSWKAKDPKQTVAER